MEKWEHETHPTEFDWETIFYDNGRIGILMHKVGINPLKSGCMHNSAKVRSSV